MSITPFAFPPFAPYLHFTPAGLAIRYKLSYKPGQEDL